MKIMMASKKYDRDQCQAAIKLLQENGPPTIRAVPLGDGRYAALGDDHVIRAAADLGMVPEIEEVVQYVDTRRDTIWLEFDDHPAVIEETHPTEDDQ